MRPVADSTAATLFLLHSFLNSSSYACPTCRQGQLVVSNYEGKNVTFSLHRTRRYSITTLKGADYTILFCQRRKDIDLKE